VSEGKRGKTREDILRRVFGADDFRLFAVYSHKYTDATTPPSVAQLAEWWDVLGARVGSRERRVWDETISAIREMLGPNPSVSRLKAGCEDAARRAGEAESSETTIDITGLVCSWRFDDWASSFPPEHTISSLIRAEVAQPLAFSADRFNFLRNHRTYEGIQTAWPVASLFRRYSSTAYRKQSGDCGAVEALKEYAHHEQSYSRLIKGVAARVEERGLQEAGSFIHSRLGAGKKTLSRTIAREVKAAHRQGEGERSRALLEELIVLEQIFVILSLFRDPTHTMNASFVTLPEIDARSEENLQLMFAVWGRWALLNRKTLAAFNAAPSELKVKMVAELITDDELDDPEGRMFRVGRPMRGVAAESDVVTARELLREAEDSNWQQAPEAYKKKHGDLPSGWRYPGDTLRRRVERIIPEEYRRAFPRRGRTKKR
jgi:hypothetical protein